MSSKDLFKRLNSGESILFNVTRIPNRSKIIAMIGQGGGEIASEPDQNVISVVESSKLSENGDDFCTPQFIEYCFEEGIPFEQALADLNVKDSAKKTHHSSSQESRLQQSPLRNCEIIQSQLLFSQPTSADHREGGQSRGKFTTEQDKVLLEEYARLAQTVQNSQELYATLSTQVFNGYFSPETVQCRYELLIDLQEPTNNHIDAYYSCNENDRKKINEEIPLLSQPIKNGNINVCMSTGSEDDALIEEALNKYSKQNEESNAAATDSETHITDINEKPAQLSAATLEQTQTTDSRESEEKCTIPDSKRAIYKQTIVGLINEFKVQAEVVFWALHIHSGNVEAAKFFLTTKNYILSGAWLLDEDTSLLHDSEDPTPVAGRSAEECEKRRKFLNAYKSN